jgi:hypothetical protein
MARGLACFGRGWARLLLGAVILASPACIEEHPDFVGFEGGGQSTGMGTTGHGTSVGPTSATSAEVTSTTGTSPSEDTTTSGLDSNDDDTTDVDDTTGDDDTGRETGRDCSEEICDGRDNNCDGVVDEGCECFVGDEQSCYSGDPDTLDIGVCQAGVQVCVRGEWGPCDGEILPSAEVCNGLDDDCDGVADDGFGQVICGQGICQVTVDECVDGMPQECVPGEPEPEELCNGLDDTCDGEIDTGCPCVHGEEQGCYSGPVETEGVGQCQAGLQICEEGAWGPCEDDVTPQPEVCNGLDDDCDGVVDDGNPGGGAGCNTGLLGLCQIGELTCLEGSLQCVQQYEPSAEVCDGQDNDCDGFVDNGNPGGGDACNTGLLGVCAEGTTQCQNGQVVCESNTGPTPEICDGLDNNCDGAVDNGNPGGGAACDSGEPGVCAAGTTNCEDGTLVCNANLSPSTEVCDGQDNDCDGVIDNGNPGGGQDCDTGVPGVCAAGTTDCQGGSLVCEQNVEPSTEVCDGQDNDCNGIVDDGNPGGGEPCFTNQLGVCAEGVTACEGGEIVCVPLVEPTPEVCDGLDNDCNGVVDNGNPGGGEACDTGEPGVCGPGTTQCIEGEVVCLGNAGPTSELCDGQDNDCDGEIDNGDPGGGLYCDTGEPGICAHGTTRCEGGGIVCDQNEEPSPEICDGLDNDCNGVVDDGFGQVTCGVGICQVTVDECVDGQPQTCVPGEPLPEELCNGQDDTCDGEVDTGCDCIDETQQSCYSGPPGTEGIGICQAGIQTCDQGQWGPCTGDTTPAPEQCNGQDDDCNGQVDDGNPGGGAPCDTTLFGPCKFGEIQCVNATLQCVQVVFPQDEVCDGVDNDCNGFVDDGEFGGDACDSGQPGICADGTTACLSGSMQCVSDNEPQEEICGDGLDNNCDGLIDTGCPCAHDKCLAGGPLLPGCDPCVAQICDVMPSCCTESWDAACVNAVQTICQCGNCAWGCGHNICEYVGPPLLSGCDPGCVTDICAVDSWCCNNGWDSLCVAQVQEGGVFPDPYGHVPGVCFLSCDC